MFWPGFHQREPDPLDHPRRTVFPLQTPTGTGSADGGGPAASPDPARLRQDHRRAAARAGGWAVRPARWQSACSPDAASGPIGPIKTDNSLSLLDAQGAQQIDEILPPNLVALPGAIAPDRIANIPFLDHRQQVIPFRLIVEL